MAESIVVLITTGSLEEADRIAGALVDQMLVACVNIVPGITSVYRWQGEVKRDQECLLLAKTQREALDEVVQRVKALHSYEVPEVIALPIVAGSEAYLKWLSGAVQGNWDVLD